MKVYVISGGPSTGKTATIHEIGKKHAILPEAARLVSENDRRFSGKSIKEIDKEKFQNAIFQFQKQQLEKLNSGEIVFSDRGLGDTIAYFKVHNLKVPANVLDFAKKFRYAGIFILEPLDIYVKDSLRQEDKEEASKIHKEIIKSYEDLGYKIIFVPFMSIKKRAEFIVKKI